MRSILTICVATAILLTMGCSMDAEVAKKPAPLQTATVRVTENGYEPGSVTLRGGIPAQVTFVRTTDKTCGKEIVLPALKINKPLPLNKPVVVSFTPKKGQTLAYTCGMGMLRGKIVAR